MMDRKYQVGQRVIYKPNMPGTSTMDGKAGTVKSAEKGSSEFSMWRYHVRWDDGAVWEVVESSLAAATYDGSAGITTASPSP
jgi:hypothetical protein